MNMLQIGTLQCPDDLTRLHFKQIQGMRLRMTSEEGEKFYSALCPVCHSYYAVEAKDDEAT